MTIKIYHGLSLTSQVFKTPDYKHWETWEKLRTTWDNLGHLVAVLDMYGERRLTANKLVT